MLRHLLEKEKVLKFHADVMEKVFNDAFTYGTGILKLRENKEKKMDTLEDAIAKARPGSCIKVDSPYGEYKIYDEPYRFNPEEWTILKKLTWRDLVKDQACDEAKVWLLNTAAKLNYSLEADCLTKPMLELAYKRDPSWVTDWLIDNGYICRKNTEVEWNPGDVFKHFDGNKYGNKYLFRKVSGEKDQFVSLWNITEEKKCTTLTNAFRRYYTKIGSLKEVLKDV